MKYTVSKSEYFGWDYTVYDTETLTATNYWGCGSSESKKVKNLTKEEMLDFINKRELAELKNFQYEMKKLQEQYDKKLADIKKFKKALDN